MYSEAHIKTLEECVGTKHRFYGMAVAQDPRLVDALTKFVDAEYLAEKVLVSIKGLTGDPQPEIGAPIKQSGRKQEVRGSVDLLISIHRLFVLQKELVLQRERLEILNQGSH